MAELPSWERIAALDADAELLDPSGWTVLDVTPLAGREEAVRVQ